MKFTMSTKPLSTALDLAVIKENISDQWMKSCLAQLTVRGRDLVINLEADRIASELRFSGAPESEAMECSVFVDCLLLKQLVATLESSTVELEFVGAPGDVSALVLHAGKSKLTLPKMIDGDELSLTAPRESDYDAANSVEIDKSGWKFVKDHQMYALSMSFTYPVYTYVYVSEDGDVIAGNINTSLFTYSDKSNLKKTCLLKDTIINLFNTLPEGSKIIPGEDKYLITVSTDSFDYVAEFSPRYESEPDIGSYNADLLKEELQHPVTCLDVNPSVILKTLNQSLLLSGGDSQADITFHIESGLMRVFDDRVERSVDLKGYVTDNPVDIKFGVKDILSVFKTYSSDDVHVGVTFDEDGECKAFVIWDDEFTTVLGGVD